MSERERLDLEVEPGQEVWSPQPGYAFDLDRRDFFKLAGAGLAVVLLLDDASAQQRGRRGGGFGGNLPQEIGAWVHIDKDGRVTAYTGKVEVGQNARTSLTQVVAEELRLKPAEVKLVMGDTAQVPFDAGTFGSGTTPRMVPQLRRAAAAARELLLDLAAERTKAPRGTLVVADGKITDPASKQSVTFGELSEGKKLLKTIREDAAVTPPDRWRVEGHSVPKVNGRDLVTGKHRYASDIARPGMLYGKVVRPGAFKADLVSVDTKPAEAMPGVVVVRDGNFIGVAAANEQLAEQAAAAIRAEWKAPPQPSSEEVFEYLKKHPSQGGGFGGFGRGGGSQGDVAKGMEAADHKLKATYTVAYIAHAPLETRAAVAEWDGDRVTVWVGTQCPFRVRGQVAGAFRMPLEKVRVIVPDTGSGYGGKHTVDAAVEAARLARAAGKPVKVVWTREEEFTWAYFRPAGVIEVAAGVRNDGTLTAWEFHNYLSGGAGIMTPYAAANRRTEAHGADSPLAHGPYRALAATANHFAREAHMDDLARAVKLDPLEFRLKNLGDDGVGKRVRGVLEAAAKQFGWGKQKPSPGQGFGLAAGTEKGSYVATCAEVAVDRGSGAVRVVRAVTAFDCGAVLNPDHLKNQVEGAVVMGLGGALYEAIRFENGKILNPKFSRYRVPHFRDVPALETVLVDRRDVTSAGAGETPIVCIAPAVGNAICDATGVRLRSMPMIPDGVVKL